MLQAIRPTASRGVGAPDSWRVRVVRWLAVGGLALVMSACGGGGGGSGDETRSPAGFSVTVRDDVSALVSGATVTVTIGTSTRTALTDASGVATLTDLPLGSATVNVSKTGYTSSSQTANPVSGRVTPLIARIDRLVGSVNVSVVDAFDSPVGGAIVTAAGDGRTVVLATSSGGLAAMTGVPTGTVSFTVTAAGYRTSPAQQATIVEGANPPIIIVLERDTSAAAGSVGGEVDGTPSPDGTEVTLRLRFAVVDQNGTAITTLNSSAFQLQPCANSTPSIDCIRRPSSSVDGSYTVLGQDTSQFRLLPAQPPEPYSAALLFDQSASVRNTDPTDARVFAGKGFLDSVGAGDAVTLAAFAADGPAGGEALIPDQPLTIFGSFTSDGTSYFGEIDTFPSTEGGDTPFYAGLDGLLEDPVWSTAPVGPRRAVVVFTDGVDTDPACASERVCRQATIARANSLDIDIFAIGLSTLINVEALAELANGTGGAFLFTTDAQALIPIYGSLGALLSGSLPVYETVWTIRSTATGTFQSGHLVLGKMDITTASGVITVPFIVAI